MKGKKLTTYRVWIEQINQTYVDVRAANPNEATDKACRKWRREWAQASVGDIRIVTDRETDSHG